MTNHPILITTHSSQLHLVDLDLTGDEPALNPIHALTLKPQPSFALNHPRVKDLWYVSSWVGNVVYSVRVDVAGRGMEVLGEHPAGGEGPTFFVLTEDETGLIVANYRDGTITHLPLVKQTGLFPPAPAASTTTFPKKDILQLPPRTRTGPREERFRVRQDGPHAHHVLPLPRSLFPQHHHSHPSDHDHDHDPDRPREQEQEQERTPHTYLICDLGSDQVHLITHTPQQGFRIRHTLEFPQGYGPRHAALDPKGWVYVVHELECLVTTHRVGFAAGSASASAASEGEEGGKGEKMWELGKEPGYTLSRPLFPPISTLPPHLQPSTGYRPRDPMECIACAILFLPPHPSRPGGKPELVVTNRNAPPRVTTNSRSSSSFSETGTGTDTETEKGGDTWLSYPLSETGEPLSPTFYYGAGRHLRAIGLDEEGGMVLIGSREGEGFAIYSRMGGSERKQGDAGKERDEGEERAGWRELGRGLGRTIDLPVGVHWI